MNFYPDTLCWGVSLNKRKEITAWVAHGYGEESYLIPNSNAFDYSINSPVYRLFLKKKRGIIKDQKEFVELKQWATFNEVLALAHEDYQLKVKLEMLEELE
jgi:hypothetical protein